MVTEGPSIIGRLDSTCWELAKTSAALASAVQMLTQAADLCDTRSSFDDGQTYLSFAAQALTVLRDVNRLYHQVDAARLQGTSAE